jgi:3-oxo-5-alpha-steroid 4-dehydrogenase 1
MALVQDWLPPTRQNWKLVVYFFQFFPVVRWCALYSSAQPLTRYQITLVQWVIPWYGAGKTSGNSKLYLPGRWAWLTMEVPGFMTLLYLMNTLPAELDLAELPWQNKLLGALFVLPLSLFFNFSN